MPARLRDLEVTKVDFVDAGDNKGAHVVLFKRADRKKPGENQEGAKKDMDTVRIDKSKLTAEEAAQWEALVQKAGVPDDGGGSPAAPPAPPVGGDTAPAPMGGQEPAPTQKSAPDAPVAKTEPVPAAPAVDSGEDIYKGLHPAVRDELERLKKRADEADERELTAVAKKYELLGKKPEELVPTLKALKAAGGGAYEQMIAVLDASLQTVEKSGFFEEIGKTGAAGAGGGGDAWSQIQKHAQSMMTADPSLNIYEAIDKACQAHPELVGEYESNR